jgi:hypothetical protein
MDKLYSDLTIHSIMVPLHNKELVFTVGQKIPSANITITRIHRDEANYEFYKKLMYAIFVVGEDKKEFLWRAIPDGLNPIPTFDAND